MINHKHKFIFIHIPKCAGNTIKSSLGIPQFPGDHSKISDKKYLKNINYFKFCFTRNPWDRMLSAYKYLKLGGIGRFNRGRPSDDKYCKIINTKYKPFYSFVSSGEWVDWMHFQSQYTYCLNSSEIFCMDFIGKIENTQQDFDTICDKIGIPRQKLPHKNTTNHKHYTEYYDDETKQIVAEKYAKDIKYFGYKFGE